MPDHLEINDLSHLSDEEFHALCPIGEHAPGPEPLSPLAQAVVDAYDNTPEKPTGNHRYHWLAAALRAAAEQPYEVPAHIRGEAYWPYRDGVEAERNRNLAIAAELEGINS